MSETLHWFHTLDVHVFKSGVKVKVEDDKQMVVEGWVEKEEGAFKSTKSFLRRFNLLGKVDMETSAMSSDDVLTITAPKISKESE